MPIKYSDHSSDLQRNSNLQHNFKDNKISIIEWRPYCFDDAETIYKKLQRFLKNFSPTVENGSSGYDTHTLRLIYVLNNIVIYDVAGYNTGGYGAPQEHNFYIENLKLLPWNRRKQMSLPSRPSHKDCLFAINKTFYEDRDPASYKIVKNTDGPWQLTINKLAKKCK